MSDFDPSDHTVPEVEDYVDQHPDEAGAILDAERAGKNRTTLVTFLEAAGQPTATPQTEGDEGEVAVKPEDENVSPPGEYPVEGTWGYGEEAEPK
jgi:hypothetical protein